MADFLNMGGFASYVWSAYGVTVLALLGLAISSLRANKAAKSEVERLRPARRNRAETETT